MISLLPCIVVGLGQGVEYSFRSVTVVTVLQRALSTIGGPSLSSPSWKGRWWVLVWTLHQWQLVAVSGYRHTVAYLNHDGWVWVWSLIMWSAHQFFVFSLLFFFRVLFCKVYSCLPLPPPPPHSGLLIYMRNVRFRIDPSMPGSFEWSCFFHSSILRSFHLSICQAFDLSILLPFRILNISIVW